MIFELCNTLSAYTVAKLSVLYNETVMVS